jgi:hypothetical protein
LIDNPPTKIALNIRPEKYKVLSKLLSTVNVKHPVGKHNAVRVEENVS